MGRWLFVARTRVITGVSLIAAITSCTIYASGQTGPRNLSGTWSGNTPLPGGSLVPIVFNVHQTDINCCRGTATRELPSGPLTEAAVGLWLIPVAPSTQFFAQFAISRSLSAALEFQFTWPNPGTWQLDRGACQLSVRSSWSQVDSRWKCAFYEKPNVAPPRAFGILCRDTKSALAQRLS